MDAWQTYMLLFKQQLLIVPRARTSTLRMASKHSNVIIKHFWAKARSNPNTELFGIIAPVGTCKQHSTLHPPVYLHPISA
jgi:hypothetical protein